MASTKELLAQATKEDLDRIAASVSLRDGERLTPEFLDDIIEPNYIGPTWKTDGEGNWLLPERTLGWEIAGWATKWLRHPTKPEEPWRFTPEQLRFILWWYALDEDGQFLYQSGVLQRRKGWGKDPLLAVMCFVELVGPCRFSHWDEDGNPVGKPEQAALVLVSAVTREQTSNTADMFPLLMSDEFKDHYQVVPGIELIRAFQGKRKIMLLTGSFRAAEGKRSTFTMMNEALSLDTPIPTPSGWTTMGDLNDGDIIYGSDGSATAVTKAHDVQYGRDCFRVTFDDGNSIVASDGHWWKVRVANNRSCTLHEMTTRQMFDADREFYLPESFEQIQGVERDLPIDPYVLGLWLGDGSSLHGVIACDSQDIDETMNLIEATGEPVVVRDVNHLALTKGHVGGYTHADSFKGRLRALGLLGNKHIPAAYLRASFEQRLALLQGLMDSDGNVRREGDARFANTDRALLLQVGELLVSLGYHVKHAAIQSRPDRPTWSDCGQISFKAVSEVNPFRLARKAEQVKSSTSTTRSRLRKIVKIEQVESVPVRCISVAAEDRLFLAGRGMHATRNTHHWVSSNGGPLMYDTIDGNTAKNPMSRYLAITNAFLPGEESVAEAMRRDYENFKALGIDGGFLYDSVEAKARAPIGGPLLPLVLEKMLGDSIWFTVEQHVASMVRSIMKGSISPARSRRMWLNQVVADQDALIGPENWDPLLDDTLELGRSDEIVLGLDGGRSDDSTALVAIRPSDMAVFVLGMWERPEGPDGEGWRVDQKRVDEAVDRVHAQLNVVAFFSDVSGWETWIVQWEERYGHQYFTKATEQTMIGLDMRGNQKIITSSHESMLKAIIDGNIAHDGNFQLRRHVLNARRRENRWGISFGKESRESPKKVDGYAAMLLAYMAAIKIRLKAKRPEKKSGSRAFFF